MPELLTLGRECVWMKIEVCRSTADAIRAALERYEDAGYPGADDVESLMLAGRLGVCDHQAGKLVRNFVRLFGA